MDKKEIKLYSIVQVTSKKDHGFSNYHNKYAIVTEVSKDEEEDGDEYEIMFLDSGNQTAWWNKNDLILRTTIDSYKVAKEIINNCKEVYKLAGKTYDLIENHGIPKTQLFLFR